MVRKGNTDIGLAINEAVNLMPQDQQQQNTIILFSDGETDLNGTKTTRTLQDSYNSENIAYKKASQTNTRIFTIGLAKAGKSNDFAYLQKIANQTNGKCYTLQQSSQLPELFQSIYNELYHNAINIVDTFTGSGNYQKQIPIIKNVTDNSTIIVHTQNGIKNVTADCNNNIIYSQNYVVIQIKQPLQNNTVNIQFDVPNNDTVIIETIHHINIFPQIEPFQKNTLLHLPINVKLYQKDTAQEITNQKLYENATAELFITNIQTGEKQTITMGNAGNMFTATFENKNPQIYRFEANIKSDLYNIKTPAYEAELSNTKPYAIKNQINLLQKKEIQQLNLNEYFNDDDGDTLTYQIASKDNVFYTEIDKNTLFVKANTQTTKKIELYISDGRGGVITEEIAINILPFWIYYKDAVFKILFLFILLLITYFIIIRNHNERYFIPAKNTFHYATFEGHFLNTASGNDIPTLNWNTNYINNQKSITLGELFYILDITEKLPECYKIYFNAGKNKNILFYHNTNCSIIYKQKKIAKNKKITLHHNQKLNILFEDNITQMELQYKINQKEFIVK